MAPTSAIPQMISKYIVLPISIPASDSFSTPATHYLYLRPHEPKIPDPTTPRSLFLVNVPFDATHVHIRHLFSTQLGLSRGRVEDVYFEGIGQKRAGAESESRAAEEQRIERRGKKRKRAGRNEGDTNDLEDTKLPEIWDRELHRCGSTAVVVFVDRPSAEAALHAAKRARKEGKEIIWSEELEGKVPALGSARYLNHQRLQYPDKRTLLESVDNYMTAFAAKEAARARLLARHRQEPDEDGFITVTRGGKVDAAKQEEARERAEKQKEKQKGLEDFYRFQTREKRKEKAGELIRKFEEDKEKVKRLRERRGRFRLE